MPWTLKQVQANCWDLRHIVAKRPTRFKVVVDNRRSDLIEVLEGVYNLHDDGAALFLWHKLVLLQVEVQVIALTVLQNCAEPATREMHLTSVAGNGTSNQNTSYNSAHWKFWDLDQNGQNCINVSMLWEGHICWKMEWLTSQCQAKSSRRV